MVKLNLYLAILLCNYIYVSSATWSPTAHVYPGTDKTYVRVCYQSHLRVCAPDPPLHQNPYTGEKVAIEVDYESRTGVEFTEGSKKDITFIDAVGIASYYFHPQIVYPRNNINVDLPPDKYGCIEVRVAKVGTHYSTHSEKGSEPMYYYPTLMFTHTDKWIVDHIDQLQDGKWTPVWDLRQGYAGDSLP